MILITNVKLWMNWVSMLLISINLLLIIPVLPQWCKRNHDSRRHHMGKSINSICINWKCMRVEGLSQIKGRDFNHYPLELFWQTRGSLKHKQHKVQFGNGIGSLCQEVLWIQPLDTVETFGNGALVVMCLTSTIRKTGDSNLEHGGIYRQGLCNCSHCQGGETNWRFEGIF